jgi:hypothetical protein
VAPAEVAISRKRMGQIRDQRGTREKKRSPRRNDPSPLPLSQLTLQVSLFTQENNIKK